MIDKQDLLFFILLLNFNFEFKSEIQVSYFYLNFLIG